MNIKAVKNISLESNFIVEALNTSQDTSLVMKGVAISPRGISVHCSGEQISMLHDIKGDGSQSKYQTLLLAIELRFKSGECLQMEATAQIQSIRRVSQTEFEVNMAYINMRQDSYAHIARYVEDSSTDSTE